VESKSARVESSDNFVIIYDESENGDPFYVIICNKPLCEETFEND